MFPILSRPAAGTTHSRQQPSLQPQRPAGLSLQQTSLGFGKLAEMFSAHLEAMVNNCAGIKFSDDAEFVHQAGVSVRRLRTGLKFFHGLRKERNQGICLDTDSELKWLFRLLGDARDWDVFIAGELRFLTLAYPDPNQAMALLNKAHDQRRQAYGRLRDGLNGGRYARLLRKVQRDIGNWQLLQEATMHNLSTMAADELRRTHKRLLVDAQRLKRPTQREWHRLRIDVKKLRYATEMLSPIFKRENMHHYQRHLECAQDALNHMNELAQAARMLEVLGPKIHFRNFALARIGAGLLLAQRPTRRHIAQISKVENPWKGLHSG